MILIVFSTSELDAFVIVIVCVLGFTDLDGLSSVRLITQGTVVGIDRGDTILFTDIESLGVLPLSDILVDLGDFVMSTMVVFRADFGLSTLADGFGGLGVVIFSGVFRVRLDGVDVSLVLVGVSLVLVGVYLALVGVSLVLVGVSLALIGVSLVLGIVLLSFTNASRVLCEGGGLFNFLVAEGFSFLIGSSAPAEEVRFFGC